MSRSASERDEVHLQLLPVCRQCGSHRVAPPTQCEVRHATFGNDQQPGAGCWPLFLLMCHREVQAIFGRDKVIEIHTILSEIDLHPAHFAAELLVRRIVERQLMRENDLLPDLSVIAAESGLF